MTLIIVLSVLAYVLCAVLLGSLITWLVGKMLRLEALTYPTSAGLELLTTVLNPCVPLAYFFLDYYFGVSFVGGDAAAHPERRILFGIISTVVTVSLWLYLYKYLFEWDFKDSCLFWLTKSCTTGLLLMVLIVGIVIVITKVAQNRAAETPPAPMQEVSAVPPASPSSAPQQAPPPSQPSDANDGHENWGVIKPGKKKNSDSGIVNPK